MFAFKIYPPGSFKSLLIRGLVIFFAVLAFKSEASAENIPYCGLTLHFDSIKAIDNNNVLVSIGSDQKIIARASLEHWAVEKIILESNNLSRLPIEQLSAFVYQCVESEAAELISVALAEILKRGDSKNFSPREFIAKSKVSREIFKKTLEHEVWEIVVRDKRASGQIALIAEAIGELLVSDPQWVRAKSLRLFYLLSKPVSTYLLQQVTEQLASENINYLSRLSTSVALFGDDRSKDIYQVQLAATLSQQLIKMKFDFEALKSVISTAESSDELMDLLYPKINSLLTTHIDSLLKQDSFSEALNVASLLIPSRRTPESLAIVSQFLTYLKLKPEMLISEKLYEIFQTYSLADPALMTAYVDMLESHFVRQIESDQIVAAELTFQRVLAVRPDPSDYNDNLRFKLALTYTQSGLTQETTNKVTEIKNKLGLYQTLQLFMAGSLWNMLVLVLILIIAFGLLVWLLNKIGFLDAGYKKLNDIFDLLVSLVSGQNLAKVRKAEDVDSESEARAAAFVRLDRMRAVNPVQVDYEKKISVFNLNRKSTLKDIKTAYRTAVKECHPDLNPHQTKVQTERFSELTKTYEEILELRKQLGLLD